MNKLGSVELMRFVLVLNNFCLFEVFVVLFSLHFLVNRDNNFRWR